MKPSYVGLRISATRRFTPLISSSHRNDEEGAGVRAIPGAISDCPSRRGSLIKRKHTGRGRGFANRSMNHRLVNEPDVEIPLGMACL